MFIHLNFCRVEEIFNMKTQSFLNILELKFLIESKWKGRKERKKTQQIVPQR